MKFCQTSVDNYYKQDYQYSSIERTFGRVSKDNFLKVINLCEICLMLIDKKLYSDALVIYEPLIKDEIEGLEKAKLTLEKVLVISDALSCKTRIIELTYSIQQLKTKANEKI